MLLDNELLLSCNQKITTGTIFSDNTIRLGKGIVSNIPLIVQVTKEFSDLETLKLKIQTSSDVNFETSKDIYEAMYSLNDLKLGNMLFQGTLPQESLGFLRLCFEVSQNDTETTGEITAGFAASVDNHNYSAL